jgi:signal peptide peptidase SppA
MERRAFEVFAARVAEASEGALAASPPAPSAASRNLPVEPDGTAVIPVSGALMKSVPWYYKVYGIAATAYPDIEADLAAALADPKVSAIRLEVDSPGGSSMGLKRVADAVYGARGKGKPIYARVDDLAASAAYWLASQASEISAGPMANVGSIGAYITVVDIARAAKNAGIEVDVISSGSLKGAGMPGTSLSPEQRADLEKYVGDIKAQFVRDVARGRGAVESKMDSLATGATWLSEEALKLGLVDRIESPQQMTARQGAARAAAARITHLDDAIHIHGETVSADVPPAAKSATQEKQEETMAENQKAADDAVAAERKRVADIQAAFSKNPAFAIEAIGAGWSVVEARAKYADILEVKAEEDRKALAAAQADAEKAKADAEKAKKALIAGAEPIRAGGNGGEGTQASKGDFMAVATEYREKQGFTVVNGKKVWICTMVEAMKHVRKTQPELHHSFLEAAAAKAPQVKERKDSLGMKD